jgi:DNA-binding SARP family transcriptional activator/tetratricopeptide (TPR) repeat protein
VEIRTLGAVEVWADGAPVPIGGSKPRALLAALALSPGQIVSMPRLIDVVWGIDPPATATGLVQTYVSALRRLLPATGQVIATRSPGYVLLVDPDDIDHVRFERLVAEARAALAAGREEQAARLFGAALELWRGPALGEFAGGALAAEAAKLNELRLAVIEERAATELALGHFEAVVGELVAAVREHPARELLRRHLMVALFALDRQADALTVFRDGREVLLEEHGVEPGPALSAAHEAILRGDHDALGVRARRSALAAPDRPAQLPAVPPDFTGRQRQLAELTSGLSAAARSGAAPVRVVSGPGGVGKSALALRAAHDLAQAYPDGQLFAKLHGTTGTPASTEAILGRFLTALGLGQSDLSVTVEERAERYRSMLAGRRVLVLLDDAATEDQVRPLLPHSPGCAVLVTSRHRLAGLDGARRTELAPLEEAEAVELLTRVVGDQRATAEPEAVRRLVRQCALLPLAVRIIGAWLATHREWLLGRAGDRLAEQVRRLDGPAVADQQVRAGFGLSYDALPDDAKVALRRLGGLGLPELPAWVVGALLDVPQDVADRSVEHLVDAQLLTFAGVDACGQVRYALHDLPRSFAAERAESEDGAEVLGEAVGRVIDCWVQLIDTVMAGRPTGGLLLRDWQVQAEPLAGVPHWLRATASATPRTWFTVEHHCLVASVERAAALDLDRAASNLASALSTSFAVSNLFDAWTRTHNAALEAVRRAANRRAEGVLLAEFGQLRHKQDRLAEARYYLARALQVFRDLGDRHGEAATLAALGAANHEQGHLGEALRSLDLADTILHELGDEAAVAYTARLSGLVHLERGDFEAAYRQVGLALTTFRRTRSRRGEAMAMRTLSLVHRATGDYAGAYEVAEQARAIFRDTGDELLEGYSARSVAKALIRLGRGDETAALLDQALETSRTLGDRWGEAMTLRTMGERDLAADRLGEAARHLEAAIRLWRAIDLPLHQARTHRDLADVHAARGELSTAARLRAGAVEVFRLYGSREAAELTALTGER